MAGEIVPFGKYKGQPVEAMAQDKAYVDWLTAQPWFKDKFSGIYTLIVNNFQEPTETPEHNQLQMLFLDVSFRNRFLSVAIKDFEANEHAPAVYFEHQSFDVYLKRTYYTAEEKYHCVDCYVEIKPEIGDDFPAVLRQIKRAAVAPRMEYGKAHYEYEDRRAVLLLENYTGRGATEAQFIAFFENEGIKVVFVDEVINLGD